MIKKILFFIQTKILFLIQAKYQGVALVYTLVAFTTCLLLAGALAQMSTYLNRSNHLKYVQLKREIHQASILTKAFSQIKAGDFLIKDRHQRTIYLRDSHGQVKWDERVMQVHQKKSWMVDVQLVLKESKRKKSFLISLASPIHQAYKKSYFLNHTKKDKLVIQGPIYARRLGLVAPNKQLQFVRYPNQRFPVMINGSFSINHLSDQSAIKYFSTIIDPRTEGTVRNVELAQSTNFPPHIITDGLYLKGLVINKPQKLISSTKQTNILHANLSIKKKLFKYTGQKAYNADLVDSQVNGRVPIRLYLLPPSKGKTFNDTMAFNVLDYADQINAKSSFYLRRGKVVFHPSSTRYLIKPEASMILTKNSIRMFSERKSYLPKGRELSKLYLDGKRVSFDYDAQNRVLAVNRLFDASYLTRGDGRKRVFPFRNEQAPEIVFVDGRPSSFTLVGNQLYFLSPPPYGSKIETVSEMPSIEYELKDIGKGTWVYSDLSVPALLLPLDLDDDYIYTSDQNIVIQGEVKKSLYLKTTRDIFLLTHTNESKSPMVLSARNVYVSPELTEIKHCFIHTLGERVHRLGKNEVSLNISGSFYFEQSNQKVFSEIDGAEISLVSTDEQRETKWAFDKNIKEIKDLFYIYDKD